MQQPWWMPLVASLCGVSVGFLLSQGKDWLSRRRRRRAHWAALGAELELCRRNAETYVHDRVLAPLYRLPTIAYKHSLPALLGEGAIAADEVSAVMQYFSEAETLNRGMDLAQGARASNDQKMLGEEVQRNVAKAKRLCQPTPGHTGANYYDPARAVIEKHV